MTCTSGLSIVSPLVKEMVMKKLTKEERDAKIKAFWDAKQEADARRARQYVSPGDRGFLKQSFKGVAA